MAWVKLDDSMPTHPKLVAAGPAAFALDVAAICYSNRHETDGFVADSSISAVFPGMRNVRKVAATLCEVGRWIRDDEAGGWWIHDVLDYQFSAKDAAQRRAVRAEAGRKGGRRSGEVRANREANGKQNVPEDRSKPSARDEPRPDPTRPDPYLTSPPVDKHTLGDAPAVALGDPVVVAAIDLEVERRTDDRRSAGTEVGDPVAYAAGIRRRVVDDRAADLARIRAERPDLVDPAALLAELDLERFLS